jgi:hypothetical protein
MDARDIVVFLGPSLPVDDARRTLAARYLGPACCGDVLRARRLRPRVIAIVDGLFAQTAAVWHKEIMLALDDGIAVFGASSMGALRAAELAPFGMIGIGRIFEAYRDGVYTDDDEVALLHGSAESAYREMSDAMVNIRATVAHAVRAGIVCPESAERIVLCARNTFYQERSLARAIETAWGSNPHADEAIRFRQFIASGGYVNQKRLDAEELLAHLAQRDAAPPAVSSPVHRTTFILKLHYETMCRPFEAGNGDLPPDERVALEAVAFGHYPLLCRLAQLMAVVHATANGRDARQQTHADSGAAACSARDFGPALRARTQRRIPARHSDEIARVRSEERLACIRSLVGDYERRHGRRATQRVQRRHMFDLMRLDGSYSRFRSTRRSAIAGATRSDAGGVTRTGGVEIGLYRRTAMLWAIVEEHLDRARVDLPVTLQSLSDEFRRKRGLEQRAATLAWRRAHDLDSRGYERLVALEARLALVTAGAQAHALGVLPATDPACWLVDAIRLTGLYGRLERRVARACAEGVAAGNGAVQE